ncbi:alanine:cation symporter family protein [Peptostreptococcus anaerobius]|uniref:Alanine:cation symporter family protein n=1 Tax=Peptostreptococcus porci TaxID=2652282 RepID=A0A6N7XEE2_9FIRM|nr:alanine/glycine:cation symporter family protein [Peptostreptococcus porci]MST61677.1 alanine:cation symporter family protein [Peptostreptococcus porci]
MFEAMDKIVLAIVDVIYQPWCVPLLLIAGGIYFTFRTGLMQVRHFGESIRVVTEKPSQDGGVSSFGALMVSTASRVGTGNIIGVCTAIILGGAGAIFWMWVTAFIGGATAFVESTLAQVYKKKNPDGSSYGGPAFYMRDALNARWLGVIFSCFVIFTYAVGYNMLAAYNLQSTFKVFSFYGASTPAVIGAILTILFGIIIFGGAKRLINVTGLLVPIMGVIYVAVSIIVLIMNIGNIPHMFGAIFASAFDFKAIFGGFAGSCLMWGLKRGLYSNEAGMGSAPNAAAMADVSHPVKQGLVQMLSVFIDTLLICTATAFMCLSTNVSPANFVSSSGADAAGYVQASIGSTLGSFGPIFIAVAMSLFAFTTLIGNYSYCEGCLRFILNRDVTKTETMIFRGIATILIFVGAVADAGFVWDTADLAQGLMVITNVPSILILGGIAVSALKDYEKQKKAGKDPHFKSADINLKQDTDFWK